MAAVGDGRRTGRWRQSDVFAHLAVDDDKSRLDARSGDGPKKRSNDGRVEVGMVRSGMRSAAGNAGFNGKRTRIGKGACNVELPRRRRHKVVGVGRRIVPGAFQSAVRRGAQRIIARADRFAAVKDQFSRCTPRARSGRRVHEKVWPIGRIYQQPDLEVPACGLEFERRNRLGRRLRRDHRRQCREEQERVDASKCDHNLCNC